MSSAANTTNEPATPQSHSQPSIIIILTITLLIFFIIGFFSIFFCRCFLQRLLCSWRHRHSPSGTPVGPAAPNPGLDPEIIKLFPTFTYSNVKEYRREKYGLECAICLCEFEDSDVLRLLTSCCHVFHQDCIDLWLESHQSCPVCRRTLEAPPEISKSSPDVISIQMHEEGSSEHSVRITIEDEKDESKQIYEDAQQEPVAETSTSGAEQNEEADAEVTKFSRSKTTGHSIVKNRDTEKDKYTLILPDHVTAKLMRGHIVTKSETTFGEFKSKTTTGNGGFGEVSELSRADDNKL